MRRALAAAAVVVASPAVADVTPPPKPLRVAARLDGDVARFSVRYLERAGGKHTDTAGAYSLPARGLVTAATVSGGGRRHVLELVNAEQASHDFHALWEAPPGRAPRSAMLIEANAYASSFAISTAVARAATLVLDVQIAAPTCFHRDARYVAIPGEWVSRLPASMHVPESQLEAVDASCPRAAHEPEPTWVRFPARELAARPSGADRIGAYAGRARVGKTSVVKLELNLAARMSEIPHDLVTAIVVDASRSTTKQELEAQRETIDAYLRAAPHGRVQVIEYARHARALLPSWTTASQAAPRIDRELRAMQRKNGSNIEAGLREAGRWLDQTSGTRRIVLLTDENLTTRSEHTHAIDDALPAGTLVHVVALGGEGLTRDDRSKLARIAAKTRGLSVRGGERITIDGKRPAPLDATLLARPITFDHVRVRAPNWQALPIHEHACPELVDPVSPTSFEEGSQCTWWGQGNAVSSPLVIEGFLWGERVERVLRADSNRSLDVVRELSAMRILEEELQKLAEGAARAVNSVWSLYASWGGNDGHAEGHGSIGSWSSSSCGGCSSDHVGGSGGFGVSGLRPDLSIELTRIVQTCKPAHAVDVEVETTFDEIVDVTVQAVSADTRACVEAALWDAWLVVPRPPPRMITRFTVQPT